MSKFFIEKSQLKNHCAHLTGQDVTHITRVLRLKPGDELLLCDGEGMDYQARILSFDKATLTAEILAEHPSETEPNVKVTLYQGLPKQGKMEWIIEKCTEMGVTTIVPVQMTRSVVKLDSAQAAKKLERWQKTAREAAKQCGRGQIPQIMPPVDLETLTKEELPEFLLLPYEEERTTPVKEALRGAKAETAGIFIGPEGGFTPEEAAYLVSLGARSVSLGRRILRTETAGLAALALLLYEFDEMHG
ncbi:MAG: 16S rRNA (uracil(1498)-N(3))-methyltransferase [Ruminococcaceae bacterium]|nr:16S rRNA (uracil(1498)-N(3))-methyltransferase [Oscillospiraceae bacterium]